MPDPALPTTTTPPLPAELELLLACARPRLEPSDERRIADARGRGIDWERLVRLARLHGLHPLLHQHAAKPCVDMPAAPLSTLSAAVRRNSLRTLALTDELLALLRFCAEARIPATPLKGLLLSELLYGAAGLRPAGDIDLLVRKQDVAPVRRFLEARGYRFREDGAMADRDLHHLNAVHPQRRVTVELHYLLLRPRGRRRFDYDAVAPHLRPATFIDVPVMALQGEELLVYLAEHGAGHTWIRLEWLAGIAALLRSGAVRDWPLAHAWAETLGAGRRVRAASLLGRALFDPSFDPRLDPRLDPMRAAPVAVPVPNDRLAARANRAILRRLQVEPERAVEQSAERVTYLFLTDTSLAACARRGWSMLLAPGVADSRALPLPRALHGLYWVVRPLRLLRRGSYSALPPKLRTP